MSAQVMAGRADTSLPSVAMSSTKAALLSAINGSNPSSASSSGSSTMPRSSSSSLASTALSLASSVVSLLAVVLWLNCERIASGNYRKVWDIWSKTHFNHKVKDMSEASAHHSPFAYKDICHFTILFYDQRWTEVCIDRWYPRLHLLFCFSS